MKQFEPYVLGWAAEAFYKNGRITSVSGTYTVLETDHIVMANGTFTVNLPPATGSGNIYVIKNSGSGTITVDGFGAQPIDGAATKSLAAGVSAMLLDVTAGNWGVI